jgi:hypothetical protein
MLSTVLAPSLVATRWSKPTGPAVKPAWRSDRRGLSPISMSEKVWSHLLSQLPRDWPDALAPLPAPKHH